jgi:hypothetical protein
MATKAEKAALAAKAAALMARAIVISGMTAAEFNALSDEERNSFTAQAGVELEQEALTAEIEDDGLISLELNGDEIRVHATCVDDHKRIGWKVQ